MVWKTQGNREEQVIRTRLRITHSAITYKYMLEKKKPDKCEVCNVQITVKRIIIEYQKYTEIRGNNHMPDNLKEALKNDLEAVENILKFIKEMKLAAKI